jgi:molybdopterin-guanine dinucleotide biosynthesis protein MobB
MPQLLSIVGRKNSGKTTLVVQLAAELTRRGHRIMTIKHGTHTFNIDPSTTDTYRHYHEGHAERVAMVSPDKFALVMRTEVESGPEDIAARYMSDADLVLCEGFKASALPRIEVHRTAVHPAPLFEANAINAAHFRAIVTDADDADFPLSVFLFSNPAWLSSLADWVEHEYL